QRVSAVQIVGEARGLVAALQSRTIPDGALWIDVDQQRLHAASRECCGEIDCGGGFADSSLLAYDSEDSAHSNLESQGSRSLSPWDSLVGARSLSSRREFSGRAS